MKKKNQEITARIKQHLRTLKLTKIEKHLDEELAHASKEGVAPSDLLERLLALEANALIERRIERRIRQSKLSDLKLLSDFDFEFQKGMDKSRVMELATLGFAERKQGLIIAGNSGTGKSHIAKALLLIGCQNRYRCRYTTTAKMLAYLMAGQSDDSLEKRLKQYTTPGILLVDELGFDKLEQESAKNASLFFKVIDGRYCKGSTILTMNVDFKELGDYLGDPLMTTSIVDRMIHHSIIMNVEGPSYRMYESKKLNKPIRKKQPKTDK